MQYEEYKAISSNPRDFEYYASVIEPYYMEMDILDKGEFIKFIETENGKMAMEAFVILHNEVNKLRDENYRLSCIITRDRDMAELKKCLEIRDSINGESNIENELREIIDERIVTYKRRISK